MRNPTCELQKDEWKMRTDVKNTIIHAIQSNAGESEGAAAGPGNESVCLMGVVAAPKRLNKWRTGSSLTPHIVRKHEQLLVCYDNHVLSKVDRSPI